MVRVWVALREVFEELALNFGTPSQIKQFLKQSSMNRNSSAPTEGLDTILLGSLGFEIFT